MKTEYAIRPMRNVVADSLRRLPSRELRAEIFERDGYCCQYCGEQNIKSLSIDHIVAWSRGGLTVRENLQVLCVRCNTEKGNR